jgi:electron transport complex protein RnfG
MKGGFIKDAIILFIITLVAGACLGGVYSLTKGPIDAANLAAKAGYRVYRFRRYRS